MVPRHLRVHTSLGARVRPVRGACSVAIGGLDSEARCGQSEPWYSHDRLDLFVPREDTAYEVTALQNHGTSSLLYSTLVILAVNQGEIPCSSGLDIQS